MYEVWYDVSIVHICPHIYIHIQTTQFAPFRFMVDHTIAAGKHLMPPLVPNPFDLLDNLINK